MVWEIHRGAKPPGEGWEPFAVDQGEVLWRRRSGPEDRGRPAELLLQTEVAELLRVDVATVRRWTRLGVIPQPMALGGVLRWSRADLLAALARGRSSGALLAAHLATLFSDLAVSFQ